MRRRDAEGRARSRTVNRQRSVMGWPNTQFRDGHFFFGTLLAGAIPRAGLGSVPSLKALGYQSPNEKLNIAGIGAGGQPFSDLRQCETENIVALADVDWARGAAGLRALGQGGEVQGLPPDARQGEDDRRGRRSARPTTCTPRGALLHAARQARLRREAADAHAWEARLLPGGGEEVQGRHADGQPGLLARGHARRVRDHLVGRDRRRHRGALVPRAAAAGRRA